MVMEKNLNQARVDLVPWVLPTQTPAPCLPGSRFLQEDVKLVGRRAAPDGPLGWAA